MRFGAHFSVNLDFHLRLDIVEKRSIDGAIC
jgi:hypothetical protein